MYLDYFDLESQPFSINAQPGFFLKTPQHSLVFNSIVTAIEEDNFLIKVVGEVGMGKTLLSQVLAKSFLRNHYVAHLPQPSANSSGLLKQIAKELGITNYSRASIGQINQKIVSFVKQAGEEKKRVIVIIDEVQSLAPRTLQMIRLLTNMQFHDKSLIQIILFGQPELDEILKQKKLRQLKQCIVHHFFLDPLNKDMTKEYIAYRLFNAGYKGKMIFSSFALQAIARLSHGIPRAINLLCHKALLITYAKRKKNVSFIDVWQAYRIDKTSPEFGRFSIVFLSILFSTLTFVTLG